MTVLGHLPSLPRYLNPALTPVARRLPPLAVIHHRGRRSGREYDTPVQAYPTRNGVLVGLAYTSNAQWARNVLAAGAASMTRAGRTSTIRNPRRRGPDALRDLPGPVALMMRALDIEDFLEFDDEQERSSR
jgi:deazaflavin-dependent oxidoreductase (nitroreductase family)